MCMLDLTKAFDSVDRGMAWQILLSRGVPPKLVALIKDLHTNHSVTIRAELDSQPIITGFKQGCTLAPDLFNIILDTVVRQLLPQLRKLGVKIASRLMASSCIAGTQMHKCSYRSCCTLMTSLLCVVVSKVCE